MQEPIENRNGSESLDFPNKILTPTRQSGLSQGFVYMWLLNHADPHGLRVFHRIAELTQFWLRPGENLSKDVENLRKALGKTCDLVKKYNICSGADVRSWIKRAVVPKHQFCGWLVLPSEKLG
ncbi:hypothetical protein N836_33165 [Leptolyngbya sp. Heron Island J]|uniref:hypothetical protein n=1 Tax=Leptolyngbya sp. Heron Island J TaxID=1385935 RepID=UPI0003B9EDA8|nr:hypothetical protein [Leptolyngbya sp. Heron Island J]ESA38281.1 hypothetical protein N836_33165 [Leptolyngbya sp. Heron Island J]